MVHDFASGGTAREDVVGDAADDGAAFGEVADILPAEGDAGPGAAGLHVVVGVRALAVGGAEGVAGVALDDLAGEALGGE